MLTGRMRRHAKVVVIAGAMLTVAASAWAQATETREVRFVRGFGIPYLPLAVMIERDLVGKNARAAGLGEVKASYVQLASGAAMTDALLAGALDFSLGGPGPLLTIWARSRGNYNIKGVAAISAIPLYLNTINPKVQSLKDFSDQDRIALPTVKVSAQAVTLQIAAEQQLGAGKFDALDRLTVSMAPPDGHNALMAMNTEITANFTTPPYSQIQLDSGKARRVLNSYDVMGGPTSFALMLSTTKFHDQNPRTYRVVLDSLEEANALIKADPRAAAGLWIKVENSKLDPDFVERMVRDPEHVFSTTPRNVMKYAEFMNRVGTIREPPASWRDLFFPAIHDKPGS